MAEVNPAPITLQRHCELRFEVRASIELEEEHGAGTLGDAVRLARPLLENLGGRFWIDLLMDYVSEAGNELAKTSKQGPTVKRLASWEVFPEDLVYCPAGIAKLSPDFFAAVVAAS